MKWDARPSGSMRSLDARRTSVNDTYQAVYATP